MGLRTIQFYQHTIYGKFELFGSYTMPFGFPRRHKWFCRYCYNGAARKRVPFAPASLPILFFELLPILHWNSFPGLRVPQSGINGFREAGFMVPGNPDLLVPGNPDLLVPGNLD